jgi:hypothetical protein
MKHLIFLLTIVLIITGAVALGLSDDQSETTGQNLATNKSTSTEATRVYPIAPGVWYPGQPMPEKPIRYYRVRCWPGCHTGSPHGKYPNKPLNMKPIFPTSTVPVHPEGIIKTK